MSLYEMANNISELFAGYLYGDIPEDIFNDTLEMLSAEFDDKADNVASVIKNETALANDIDLEIKNLIERKESHIKHVEKLKQYLAAQMSMVGKNRLETARNKITFSKSSAVVIDDEESLLKDKSYLVEKVTVKANKKAIKEALMNGIDVKGAHIETRKNILIK